MQRRLPPLESLRVFEACARHSNFSRAASELGVTPAAVSLRIRDLERRLCIQLFDRHGPKIAPSTAGAALARSLAKSFSSMCDAIEAAAVMAPTVRVTTVPTIAAMWLTPRLGRYQARANAAQIKLDVSTDIRRDGEFDVAVRSGNGPWPGLRAITLFPMDVTPMLSPALATSARLETPADLARLPLLADSIWPRWFAEAGVGSSSRPLQFCIEYPTQDLAATAAAAGAGVALLSPALFEPMLKDGRLMQPFTHVSHGPGTYSAVVAEAESRPAVLAFFEWLAIEAVNGGV